MVMAAQSLSEHDHAGTGERALARAQPIPRCPPGFRSRQYGPERIAPGWLL